MTGPQLKSILRIRNINLTELAKEMGYNSDQALHSALKAQDVRSGLIEKIAKATGRSVGSFYGEDNAEITMLRQENRRLKEAIRRLLDTDNP